MVRTILALCATSAGLFLSACGHMHFDGRDHLRIAPLKTDVTLPSEWGAAPIPIDAGSDALTDAELAPLTQSLVDAVAVEAQQLRAASSGWQQARGRASLTGCRLRAGAGRRNTVYKASCRATWQIDDVIVAEARGEATLLAPAKAVSKREAAEIARLERNPLLSLHDARRTLVAASVHTMHQLIGWNAPACGHPWEDRGPVTRQSQVPAETLTTLRNQALRGLTSPDETKRVAAIADLMRFGRSEDAQALESCMEDSSPRVRRAAAVALSELVWDGSLKGLGSYRDDPDDDVRRFVRLAIARIHAFYGLAAALPARGPAEERTPSPVSNATGASNNSTPGGRERGSTPASAK